MLGQLTSVKNRGFGLGSIPVTALTVSPFWTFILNIRIIGEGQFAVILCPFVGMDLNLWNTVYIRYRADTDVK